MKELSPAEIILMKKAGELTKDALIYAESLIKPGISTNLLDNLIAEYIIKNSGKPSFKNYEGYPKSTCISINEVVVHGIPSERKLKEGDIVSVDLGVIYKGFNGDAARTFPVGNISPEKQRLIDVTKESFFEGIRNLKAGERLGKVGASIQRYVEKNGFSVVREMTGHGIGNKMHLDPSVPNYGKETDGPIVQANTCLAIEPMVNMGTRKIFILEDGWTTITQDLQPSAHYENTVLILADRVEILTL
jgi:methionyl aminopeptidase